MTAYYNEIDPYAAQWLRNLIVAGHIAAGDVDERSIVDVRPDDLRGYAQCHFFAGIGVWSYALRRAGVPDTANVWTGSCPCQPFSAAGKGGGFADERHLWPAFHHLIRECRPDIVLGEQVASKDGLGWFDLVQADLEGTSYAAGAVDSCSAGFGAPHIRQRLYWMAKPNDTERRTDAAGRHECNGAHAGRSQGASDVEGCGGTGELADTSSERIRAPECEADRGTPRGNESARGERQWVRSDVGSSGTGASNLKGDTVATGLQERVGFGGVPGGTCGDGARQTAIGAGVHTGELADAAPSGRRKECADVGRLLVGDGAQRNTAGLGTSSGDMRPGPVNGFWSDADWLLCRDGKWRPVEPGTFPLAHGAPARVGRLRAYGNAINAEQATMFCEAALAARNAGLSV